MAYKDFVEDWRYVILSLIKIVTNQYQTAIAISCATDEANLIQHAATALRIVMAVGAFSEAADDTRGTGSTTLALRLKYEGQGEELTECFPGTYVSVITEP